MFPIQNNAPLNSPAGIEALIFLGLQVFLQVFAAFNQQNVPVSAAPAIISTLQATPGATTDHHAVISSAVNSAVDAHKLVTV